MSPVDENQIHAELAALDGVWKETAAAKGGTTVPDGDYVTNVTRMEIGKSKAGRLQVITIFTVVDGNYFGKELFRFDGLNNEQSISFFKAMCETLGLEYPTDMTDLPAAITTFMDTFGGLVNVNMKTKGEYQNLYVKGVVVRVISDTSQGRVCDNQRAFYI